MNDAKNGLMPEETRGVEGGNNLENEANIDVNCFLNCFCQCADYGFCPAQQAVS